MFSYEEMLATGDEIQINKKEAKKYYKKAADNGHVKSMINYALLNMKDNDEFNANRKESQKYFQMAADKGNMLARQYLITEEF
ncbi:hypothetical protein M9Y10_036448 [Tritrichomonas musculus]|uniref:Sel1 repeat family protein n=1 Tax=Tritrichomonas musculus TaxID=1915356 RepID=A0ABR2GUW7_9EUKA